MADVGSSSYGRPGAVSGNEGMLDVLIVDDQPAVVTALQVLLEIHDIPCVTADSPEAALARVRRSPVGVVIQDMNFTQDTTSGEEGVELFRAIRAADPDLPVLLMTAWTSLSTAVQLVKEGAADYLAKPWDDVRLVESVRTLLRLRESRLEAAGLGDGLEGQQALAERHDLCGLVYASPTMHAVVRLAVRVAAADVPVLITGPNGVGKEKLAEIVQANSRRRSRPFVRVNSGALPESLVESELFGAEAGAYTGANKRRVGRFEAADTGTLFLDEIGNLSAAGQMKLLRVLQTGEFERVGSSQTRQVDVRVVSATNIDLQAAIADGRFREDLYFRLNVIELRVPPLRDRPEDILPLATHFLTVFSPPDRAAPPLSSAAERALQGFDWPGNVRQLQNTMQRAALLAEGAAIEVSDLGLHPSATLPSPPPARRTPAVAVDTADEGERRALEAALLRADGVVSRAAAELGLSRQALYRRMERYGLTIERRTRSR